MNSCLLNCIDDFNSKLYHYNMQFGADQNDQLFKKSAEEMENYK